MHGKAMNPVFKRSLGAGMIITLTGILLFFYISTRTEIAGEGKTANVLYWEEAVASSTVEVTDDFLHRGKQLYQGRCAICHGMNGQGDGPASLFLGVNPRNFISEGFKFRTTPSGALPTDDDLFRTVTVGFPAYGMPGFHYLPEEDRWAIVHYIKTFNKNFNESKLPEVVDLGKEPKATKEFIVKGQGIYKQAGCYACHGVAGRGDGPSSATLTDNQGRPILALDLTRGGIYFKGGDRPGDTIRSFITGLNGTPMPSYLDSGFTKKQLWALAHFLKSLSSGDHQDQE